MDKCRICLKLEPDRDIYDIITDKHMADKRFTEVMLFCLGVQITQDSKLTTKLCMKCYRKTIAFYKFKTLALRNDGYLKSLVSDCINEIYMKDEDEIKIENVSLSENDDTEVKNEDSQDFQSDDELLSVIKSIKYEFVVEDTKENEPVKKSRGRSKKEKLRETEKKHVCAECGKSVKNLKGHMQLHMPVDKKKRVQCDRCDKQFSCYSARYKHVKRKHLGIKQHCKTCDKMVTNLKQHTLVMHETDSLQFQCTACQRRFISKSKLEEHMSIHTKDRPHQCKQCGKRFRTKVTMQLHERQVHDQEKTHLCQFCSKSFFKKYHLQVHLRSHTKEKPYPCPECGKSFASITILKNHRLIHSEVKTFNCTLCDMSFVRSGYLKQHMMSHIKEKRYPCKYCDVKFHRSDHRKRHEYTAHLKYLNANSES